MVLSEYHPMTVRQAYYQLVSLPDVAASVILVDLEHEILRLKIIG